MSALLRIVGLVLLGFGAVGFLVFGSVAIALRRMGPLEIGAVICFSVVSIASIAGGIALLRRTDPKEETYGIPDDPRTVEDLLEEASLRTFSLRRLNRTGWLLLLGATVLIVGQIVLFIVFRKEIGWQDQSDAIRRWDR